MARPDIEGIRVERAFVSRAQDAVAIVAAIGKPGARFQTGDLPRAGKNAPAHGIRPGSDLPQRGRHPAGRNHRIAVRGGDHSARAPQQREAAAGFIHDEPPRRADVRVRLGQPGFNDVQPHPGMIGAETPRNLGGAIGAVVGQDENLEAVGIERGACEIHLTGQRAERRRDGIRLVVNRHGHGHFAGGGGRFNRERGRVRRAGRDGNGQGRRRSMTVAANRRWFVEAPFRAWGNHTG
jgi:hypothetical protein